MADPVDFQIAEMRRQLSATTDADLAALLGVQRSAISQWRKRGRVPEKAIAKAEKLAKLRTSHGDEGARIQAIPVPDRDFSKALAAAFVTRYSRSDPQRLLSWAQRWDVVVAAAFYLLRTRQLMTGASLAECYEKLLSTDQFFEHDLMEALGRGADDAPTLPQSLPQSLPQND